MSFKQFGETFFDFFFARFWKVPQIQSFKAEANPVTRHPRKCRNGGKCKFFSKNICAYKHDTLDKNDEDVDKLMEENKTLIREIDNLKAKNKMLEGELKRYLTSTNDKENELVDDMVGHEPVKQNEEIRMFVCEKCDFTAYSAESLNTHISEKHTTENLKNNTYKLFLCDHCSFASNVEEKFKNHTENYHGLHEEK